MEFDKEERKVLHMTRIKPFIVTGGNEQAEYKFCWTGPRHSGWTLPLAGARNSLTVTKTCFVFEYSSRDVARTLRVGIILFTGAGEVTPATKFGSESLKFKTHVEKLEAAKSDQCD